MWLEFWVAEFRFCAKSLKICGTVPGVARKSFHWYNVDSFMNATESCNTAIERIFCGLFMDDLENCQKLCYDAKLAFFWQVAESANKPIY